MKKWSWPSMAHRCRPPIRNPGRTFALRRAAGSSFDLVRRTPRADGTIETVTQRYDLSVSGRLRVTYNSDNPPPAWLIGVLVLERVQ
jgi:hypothetical protein